MTVAPSRRNAFHVPPQGKVDSDFDFALPWENRTRAHVPSGRESCRAVERAINAIYFAENLKTVCEVNTAPGFKIVEGKFG
jgi:hypothetical protein